MNLPDDLLEKLKQVRGKRARIVVDHILAHGSITTDDLVSTYGYKHPPRAIRDVREQGINLESYAVRTDDGRVISGYRFDLSQSAQSSNLTGRGIIPKAFRQRLIASAENRCAFCGQTYPSKFLQIDHRVPYAVGGDAEFDDVHYVVICRACNRSKSWTCEHCPNWTQRDIETCQACYWAFPNDYQHIATQSIRQITLILKEDDADLLALLEQRASMQNLSLSAYIVQVLKSLLD